MLQVELGNLSNCQQTALANAQIEAALRMQELSNEQQAAANEARIAELKRLLAESDFRVIRMTGSKPSVKCGVRKSGFLKLKFNLLGTTPEE